MIIIAPLTRIVNSLFEFAASVGRNGGTLNSDLACGDFFDRHEEQKSSRRKPAALLNTADNMDTTADAVHTATLVFANRVTFGS